MTIKKLVAFISALACLATIAHARPQEEKDAAIRACVAAGLRQTDLDFEPCVHQPEAFLANRARARKEAEDEYVRKLRLQQEETNRAARMRALEEDLERRRQLIEQAVQQQWAFAASQQLLMQSQQFLDERTRVLQGAVPPAFVPQIGPYGQQGGSVTAYCNQLGSYTTTCRVR
jgi:hypothetical protein